MKSKSSLLSCAIVFALAMLLVPVSLHGQELRGKIVGRVLDQNKAAVPGATIKITDTARNATVTLTTNADGLFEASYLVPGNYQVVVEAAGFKKSIQDGVQVQINETRNLEIAVEVGGTQETVTVTAEPATLNVTDANLGQTVDQKRLAELPLVHGDPYTLVGLAPGVTYTGSTKLDRPFEPTHVVGYAMDGVRGIRSDMLIDGAPSTATANGNEVIASYVPPSDIVQEFKVQTATFDSQFGNTEGGVTSIVIKSGTNQLHGTAYFWEEPGGLAANDFFGKAKGLGRPFTYSNRPGFSINGPVVIPKLYKGKNKTFFLFGWERIHDSRPRFDAGGLVYVPTQALKDGNFSGLGVTIYDPASSFLGTGTGAGGNGCAVGVICRKAFPGNIIPLEKINPVAKAIAATFGQPKGPGLNGNIFDSQLTELTKKYDTYTFRIDQNIGAKDRFFVRGSWYERIGVYNDYTASAYSGVNFGFRSRQAVIDDVHTFNATTVLNLRYGYNRFIRIQDQEPDAQNFDLTTLSFPASYNNLIPEAIRRFPRFDFPANTVLSNGMSNEFRPVGSHFATAIINKAMEKHSLKFGGEMRIYREDDRFKSNDQTGQFIFDNTYTRPTNATTSDTNGLQALASFLLGYPTTLNLVRRADYSEYSKTWGLFLQDSWRLNNKLTLSLGLRWEFESPLVERQNKSVSGFDTTYVQPLQAAAQAKYATLNDPALKAKLPQITAMGGLLFAGKDTGRGLYNTPKNGFLPRIGLAYQFNNKTVIRGGFGLYQGFLGERRGDVIQPGYTQTTTAALNPIAPGVQIPYTLSTPFANSTIVEPSGNSLGKQTALGQAISFFDQNPKVSKQARWQIGFQRELWGSWVLEAEYVGNYGYNIEINRNINTLPNQYLNADNSRTQAMIDNNAFLIATVANPFQGLIPNANASIARSALLRPFPEFGDITTTNNDGKSWYNAGQFSLQRRFSKGYTVQAAYTWSKWTQATEYLNAGDPQPTKMISDQDSPHRFALSAMYALPFGKGERFMPHPNWIANAILGGWQVDGTVQLQAGFPIAFTTDIFYNGGELSIPSAQRTTSKWFNTAAFTSILNSAAGIVAPVNHLRTFPLRFDTVRRDYIKNVDIGIKKDIQLRETMKIQLRFELLNAFNEPYFVAPVVNPATAGTVIPGVCSNTVALPCPNGFGTINTQDNYSRRAQVGFKFIF